MLKGRGKQCFGCLWRPALPNTGPTIQSKETRIAALEVCPFVRTHKPRFAGLASSADVAQLVEQLIRNQQVIGSSPIVGSI
jgi:hypothetical protein